MSSSSYELKNICKIRSGKRLPKGTDFSDTVTDYKYIRARDIKAGKIAGSELVYITEAIHNKLSRYIVNTNDIVITIVGASVGDVAFVTAEFDGVNLTENAVRLTEFDECVNSKYLMYVLNSQKYWDLMQQIAGGSAQPKLGIYKIESIVVNLPKREVQDKIVSLLSTYDDLIENNQKQIKLLEEAAQRLYKEWFVDLRFPGHETTPIIDGITQGWKVIEIGTAFKTLLGGTPSREKAEYWENGTVPWINSGKVNELRVVEPSEYITDIALNRSATKLLPKHTTLVAITGATLGQVSYTEIETCANQSVVGIVDESQQYSEYVYCYVLNNIKNIIGKATGGAQQHINKDIVNSYPIILPNDDIAVKFQSVAKPIFDKISKLLFENINLTEARDRLLPKLMSGELEV